jgi:hypothetical protein
MMIFSIKQLVYMTKSQWYQYKVTVISIQCHNDINTMSQWYQKIRFFCRQFCFFRSAENGIFFRVRSDRFLNLETAKVCYNEWFDWFIFHINQPINSSPTFFSNHSHLQTFFNPLPKVLVLKSLIESKMIKIF